MLDAIACIGLAAYGVYIAVKLCREKPQPAKPDYPQFVGGSLDGEFYLRGSGEFIGYCERLPSGVMEYYRWNDRRNRWVFKRYLPVMTSERDVRRLCFAACSGIGMKGGGK